MMSRLGRAGYWGIELVYTTNPFWGPCRSLLRQKLERFVVTAWAERIR